MCHHSELQRKFVSDFQPWVNLEKGDSGGEAEEGALRPWSTLAGCEGGGKGPWVQECRWSLKGRKYKEMDSPLESPDRDVPTPWF